MCLGSGLGAAARIEAGGRVFTNVFEIGSGTFGRVLGANETTKLDGEQVEAEVVLKILGNEDARAEEEVAMRTRGLEGICAFRGAAPYGADERVLVYEAGSVSLAEVMAINQAPLPLSLCAEVLRRVSTSMAGLHARALIHRDLKPAHLLVGLDAEVVERGGLKLPSTVETLRVCDVGCAVSSPSVGLAGTPGYIAPEVLQGRRYDEKADVWSLGASVLELCLGHNALLSSSPLAPAQPRIVARAIRGVPGAGAGGSRMAGWVLASCTGAGLLADSEVS